MKQTAVEWLENGINKVLSHLPIEREEIKKLIEQVKEMEKQQIIDANTHGFEDGVNYGKDLPMNFSSAEQYYNKTFKSK